MSVLYRIFGIIVNIAAVFLAISLVMSLRVLLSSPLNMLSAFMLFAIVLYAWFSNKFYMLVLVKQKPVKRKLRDWIRVNGIVSLIYSLFIILGMAAFISNPDLILEQMKDMGVTVPAAGLKTLLYVLLVFGIVLFVHVTWTFRLVKKNISFFSHE